MTSGDTSSSGALPRAKKLVVVAAMAILGLVGCRAALRFDEPEAGADASPADRPCTSDLQCSSPLPRCNRSTGRCVNCLANTDCATNQFCDPDAWKCRPEL
jgi:hypothetical protein